MKTQNNIFESIKSTFEEMLKFERIDELKSKDNISKEEARELIDLQLATGLAVQH